jgi:hypothetical protein
MKTITITDNDKVFNYTIPETWKQVSLAQYQKLMSVEMDEMTEQQLMFHLIESLIEIPSQKIVDLKKSDVEEVFKHLMELAQSKPSEHLNLIVEIDGVEYGFNSKLSDITIGEFGDLDTYLQEGFKNLDKVMSILYRPIVDKDKKSFRVEKYDFDKCDERTELFKNKMSIDSIYGCLCFFLNLGQEYTLTSIHYLKKQNKKKESKQMKKVLEISGDGMQSSTN